MNQNQRQAAPAIDAISVSPDFTLVAGAIKAAMRSAGADSWDLW